jgi:hypothetical protein
MVSGSTSWVLVLLKAAVAANCFEVASLLWVVPYTLSRPTIPLFCEICRTHRSRIRLRVQVSYSAAFEPREYQTELFVTPSPQLVPCYDLTRAAELGVFEGDFRAIEYQATQIAPWLKARRLLLGLPSFIECQLCMAELFEWGHVAEQKLSPNTIVWSGR